ncbi:hypothetical protein C7Y69_13090 [Alteromonas sp. KS69]|jgi:hypothetical protein|uniref:Uncharacterized protein n=1 Tax=Alteromonas naphthalenivorans TaxID=715451 RepID=F5Z458_ALTNA|nr:MULTISPECIES: hypothetical protein [Alteromonas]AEF02640.1 hypothetical protein ambt_05480 [Alteromonas naphthalenivorans]RUP79351.1 hypothetical protein C7Y69_13090 [Alteromonas sp. KS69]
MKYVAFALILTALSVNSYAFDPKQARQSHKIVVKCKDIAWSDIQTLVQPYLSDDINAALVMQGQNANYKVSLAAEQIIGEPLPDVIITILESIIAADC